MSRPEGTQPAALYYNENEARKYNASSRIISIQEEITMRAMEMLSLPENEPRYILDIGCGSGLSGEVLESAGHYWVGCDISKSMLEVACEKDSDCGDLLHADMGQGLPFRPGTFDGVISISALQWLCYSESSAQDPRLRLNRFFSSLYTILKRDAKAVLQFYPESPEQALLIAQCASKVGFAGGVVVDYPNSSKAKKFYLFLSFERAYKIPKALGLVSSGGVAENQQKIVSVERVTSQQRRRVGKREGVKVRDWVQHKKERRVAQGKEVKSDSKYTARKRKDRF